MLLLRVKRLFLYSPLEFVFGERMWDKMFGVYLFKEEHTLVFIWQGRQINEKPL
jgi:hypothetical protein